MKTIPMRDLPPYELAIWTNAKGTDFVFYKYPIAEENVVRVKVLYSTSKVLKYRPTKNVWRGSWECVPLGEYVKDGE